jgi:hypothetical protein
MTTILFWVPGFYGSIGMRVSLMVSLPQSTPSWGSLNMNTHYGAWPALESCKSWVWLVLSEGLGQGVQGQVMFFRFCTD